MNRDCRAYGASDLSRAAADGIGTHRIRAARRFCGLAAVLATPRQDPDARGEFGEP